MYNMCSKGCTHINVRKDVYIAYNKSPLKGHFFITDILVCVQLIRPFPLCVEEFL